MRQQDDKLKEANIETSTIWRGMLANGFTRDEELRKRWRESRDKYYKEFNRWLTDPDWSAWEEIHEFDFRWSKPIPERTIDLPVERM